MYRTALPKLSHFRNAVRYFIIILFSFLLKAVNAQTLGGATSYRFLNLSSSPITTAAGGINISYSGNNAGPAFSNPALLLPSMDAQLNLDFSVLPGGIKTYHLSDVYQPKKKLITLAGGVFFIDYGNIQQTDAAGNVYGNFKASEYNIQVSASKQYLEKWRYGATVKFIHSSFGLYQSSAVATDIAVAYTDSAKGFKTSILAKNMGLPITTFAGTSEELPFDLQIGITKKLSKTPFAFSATIHHLHQFNLLYRDSAFNVVNNLDNQNSLFKKAANHFVLATHIYIGNNLEGIIGYNQLRSSELNVGAGSGLTGFSAGFAAHFNKFHFSFAHSAYQRGISYNQFGLTLLLNRLVGL